MEEMSNFKHTSYMSLLSFLFRFKQILNSKIGLLNLPTTKALR